MIQTGPGTLQPMYKSIVSIFANILPHVKDLSLQTWESYMKTLEILINRMHLNEENFYAVGNMLEGINYQLWY